MDLEKKASAAEQLARTIRAALLIFAAFLIYNVFIVATTDDLDFVISKQITMPIINLTLPVAGTYIVAPLLVLVLHVNIIYLYVSANRQAAALASSLLDIKFQSDRRSFLLFLDQFYIFQALLSFYGSPKSLARATVVLIELVIFLVPLFIILCIQIRYLPSHDYALTFWHRFVTGADIAAIVVAAFLLSSLRRSYSYALFFGLTCLAAGYLSFFILLSPDDPCELQANRGIIHWVFGPDFHEVGAHWNATAPGISAPSLRFKTRLLRRNLDLTGRRLYSQFPGDQVKAAYISRGKSETELVRKEARGIDLSGADLRFANFQNVDAMLANFSGSDLSGSNFTSANIRYAKFVGAKLIAAKFQNAKMTRVDMSSADLTGASLYQATATGGNFMQAIFAGATLVEADLTGAVLASATLAGALVSGSTLYAATLIKADLRGARLGGSKFTVANLNQARLGGAEFVKSAAASDVRLHLTSLRGVEFGVGDKAPFTIARAKLLNLQAYGSSKPGGDLVMASLKRLGLGMERHQTKFELRPEGDRIGCDEATKKNAKEHASPEVVSFLGTHCDEDSASFGNRVEDYFKDDLCEDEDATWGFVTRITLDDGLPGENLKEHLRNAGCDQITKPLLSKLDELK